MQSQTAKTTMRAMSFLPVGDRMATDGLRKEPRLATIVTTMTMSSLMIRIPKMTQSLKVRLPMIQVHDPPRADAICQRISLFQTTQKKSSPPGNAKDRPLPLRKTYKSHLLHWSMSPAQIYIFPKSLLLKHGNLIPMTSPSTT